MRLKGGDYTYNHAFKSKQCLHCGETYYGLARSKYCSESCNRKASYAKRMADPVRREARRIQHQPAKDRYYAKVTSTAEGGSTYIPVSQLTPDQLAAKRLRVLRYTRMKRASFSIPYSVEQLRARYAFWGNRCWICRCEGVMEADHVKPISKGGPDILANIRPACRRCNVRKRARWPIYESGRLILEWAP